MVQITSLAQEKPSLRIKIGVLALQGAFIEHVHLLQRLDQVSEVIPVKSAKQLLSIDALIIPGGESTTIALVAERSGLMEPLREFVYSKPTWGTCAGMILIANEVKQTKKGGQKLLGGLDISVTRNQFGSQINSFEAPLHIKNVTTSSDLFPAIFIRAPVISSINASDVEIIAKLEHQVNQTNGAVAVAVQQGHLLATAFHPELTNDERMHRYFVKFAIDFISKCTLKDPSGKNGK
ncbi:hypothetical protein G9A89_005168 [Geosiphon pyriformis]|nr:hypothetical protein G9A89_005168 [Geosiphon pyriformis]